MSERKHNHYFKPFPYNEIDIYRIILEYNLTDPCLQHALKKILCCGIRGAKSAHKDIAEAIDSLTRWQEMRVEENIVAAASLLADGEAQNEN